MLNSTDIGTVEVIENTNSSLCQEPIETIPSSEVTQLLSNLQTNHSDSTMVAIPKATKFLKHNDFMEVASKLSDACKRSHKFGTIVSGIMLKMLDIAKGHKVTNIGNFEESLEKSFPKLIQKYTLAFKPVKTNQYIGLTSLQKRISNQAATTTDAENHDEKKGMQLTIARVPPRCLGNRHASSSRLKPFV